eukprot:TRINITY_DN26443_c0_g1_i1.p1 TRINITY_DN26443_c0_g1~~TRINITY_DN26443_c0_g1_i1.p1  ORF type:complete len:353 (+),score=78.71 TRINITY_DN26443_c0_g1_i1:273-1331(+)
MAIVAPSPLFWKYQARLSGGKTWKKTCMNGYHRNKPRSNPRLASIRALLTEAVRESFLQDELKMRSWRGILTANCGVSTTISSPTPSKLDDPLLWNTYGPDDHKGCSLFAAIMEWEGVIVEDDSQLQREAWFALAEEEGQDPPRELHMRTLEGKKSEEAISEVLHWSNDPLHVRRLALRKEELYDELQEGRHILLSGSVQFVSLLKRYNIPTALTTVRPRKYLDKALEAVGMKGVFDVVVTSEDISSGKPDPEMFCTAAKLLDFTSERCIVFGNSNPSVEAAHDSQMKCVAVASKHAIFELRAADIVVERLDELSIMDLKKLAVIDLHEFQEKGSHNDSDTEVEEGPSQVLL